MHLLVCYALKENNQMHENMLIYGLWPWFNQMMGTQKEHNWKIDNKEVWEESLDLSECVHK